MTYNNKDIFRIAKNLTEKKYTIKDVKEAECNLEPLHCVQCDSKEVTYHQYVGDAYCSDCGIWQED